MKSKQIKIKKGSSQRRSFFIEANKKANKDLQKNTQRESISADPSFNSRKTDHLALALDNQTQPNCAERSSQLSERRFIDCLNLRATAFPEINFDEVSLSTQFQGHSLSAPFFISSMTSGTPLGVPINESLAQLSQEKKILMGVGSQRKELNSDKALKEWNGIRKKFPNALLLSNLGLSQLITTPIDRIKQIIENLEALGLIIHCNALQECLQKEGTPYFKNGLATIEKLVSQLKIPIIVKEVGFGFSQQDLVRLNQSGVTAVDFSGRGGTNWANIEALRYPKKSIEMETGFVFSQWGYDIKEWVDFLDRDSVSYQFWSSGGIRNGLDVAKMIAVGAHMVGMAQPWLKSLAANLVSEGSINKKVDKLDVESLFKFYDKTYRELKIALFCCGFDNLESFRKSKVFYVK